MVKRDGNIHGLAFEEKTKLIKRIERDLPEKYDIKEHVFDMGKFPKGKFIVEVGETTLSRTVYDLFDKVTGELIGVFAQQNQFYNVLQELFGLSQVSRKRWKPDEVFFNLQRNVVFIVEKKTQKVEGSVDEKLMGFGNKRELYQRIFNQQKNEPKTVVQFASLFNSKWWLKDSYEDYYDKLRDDGVRIQFDEYDYWWFGLADK